MTQLQKVATVIVIAICLVLAIFFEWSSANAPRPNTVTNSDHQRATSPIKNDTPSVALIAWARDNHDSIEAIAAIFSVVFTVALVGSNLLLWSVTRTAANAAKEAADAATKSADVAEAALTVAERPYLVLVEPKMNIWRYGSPGMPITMHIPPEYVGKIIYGVINKGRTIAFLKEITARLIFASVLPDKPNYRDEIEGSKFSELRTVLGHYPLGNGQPYECPIMESA
jgi:uncharacterized protein YpmB